MLATTLRLWAQRRLRPMLRRIRPASAKGWVISLAVLAVLGAVAVTVAVVLPQSAGPARRPSPHAGRPAAAGRPGAAALAAAASARRQAAAWVARQVNGNAIIACDPAMCAALQAQRIPAGRLRVLRPGRADPLGSDLLLATAPVRSQFGARLASVYAPVTLAVFGSGTAQVAVRVVAPDGAAAYRTALANDIQRRKQMGAALARNPRIHFTRASRAQLIAGQVDARVLMTLATLAGLHPVDVLGFSGPSSQGASPGLPLRSMEITPARWPRATPERPRALRRVLLAQRPPYRPLALTLRRSAHRRTVLRVEFAAPAPLGLLRSPH